MRREALHVLSAFVTNTIVSINLNAKPQIFAGSRYCWDRLILKPFHRAMLYRVDGCLDKYKQAHN